MTDDAAQPGAPAAGDLERGIDLEALEAFAVELANVAGEEMVRSLDREIVVSHKDEGKVPVPIDVVTDVDRLIEERLFARVRERYPEHGFIGEEGTLHGGESGVTWVVDPIDGTQNFVNALPIYSASVAVMVDRRPVAGAIWAASSHRLRPGVYHAHLGGALRFDGEVVRESRPARHRMRGLGQLPHDEDHHLRPAALPPNEGRLPYDRRHVGSGALEAAWVAVGVLRSAFNTGPRPWDIAAGVVLARAGGQLVLTPTEDNWEVLEDFGAGPLEDLREWRRPVLFASPETFSALGWRLVEP